MGIQNGGGRLALIVDYENSKIENGTFQEDHWNTNADFTYISDLVS